MNKAAGTLMLLALLAPGIATSFAGEKPTAEQARKKFEAADAALNKTYKETCAALDKTKVAALRDAERDWIAYRDRQVQADFGGGDDTPNHTADYWDAMTIYAQERAAFLRAWTGKSAPPGTPGEYSDSYDGALELNETNAGIEFSLSVARGTAHNEGSIEGVLQRKGDTAYFKQQLDPGQEGPPCELVFTFIENHIVRIEEKVPDSLAGHNVHYDGDYYKIGKLKKQAAEPEAVPNEDPKVAQARKAFENTDNLLTVAYKEAGAALDQAKMAELRQMERDWIQYREMLAKSAPYFNGGSQTDSPLGTVDYWQTMNEITRARIDFLHAYTAKGLPTGLTGVYTDSYGGTLKLEEKKSGLLFIITTVRGMARNKGRIDGIAQRAGDKAVFKDRPAAGDDRPPCEITFTFIEGHIVKVEEKNGDDYHDPTANFDGTYYKTGKLEKPLKVE